MKILRLEICNLASLTASEAQPHVIDFTCSPLAGAGLIAITGPTGAGKSTILDAICLALFNRIPRLRSASSGQQGSVPDGENRPLGFDDPRTVLTRGAGSGYCRLDIENQAGQQYRFEWRLKRARLKATGKLQEVERSIVDLQTRQVLAVKKTECDSLTPKLIGLDFEQFTRAVLLAQSEFGAFLKASDNERARLLECLTSTSIFGKTGQRAYYKAKEMKQALEALEQTRSAEQPLDESARQQLEQTLATRQGELQNMQQQLNQLERSQQWFVQDVQLQTATAQMQSEVHQAKQALQTFQPVQQRLAQHRLALQIQPQWQRIQQLNAELGEQQTSLQTLALNEQQAQTQLAELQQLVTRLQQPKIAMQQTWQDFSSKLPELRKWEEQKLLLTHEYKNFRQQQTEKEQQQQAVQQRAATLRQQLEQLIDRFQTAGDMAPLDHSRLGLPQLLSYCEQKLASDARQQLAAWADSGGQIITDLNELTLHQLQEQTAQDQTQGLAQQQQLRQLTEQQGTLQLVKTRLQQLQQCTGELEQLSTLQVQLQHELTETATRQQTMQQQLTVSQQVLKQLEQLVTQQRLLTHQSVEALRGQLQPDTPCMVCGSTAHPFIEHGSQLQQLLETRQEAMLKQAQAEYEAQLATQADGTRQLKHLEQQIQQQQQRQGILARQQQQLHHQIDEHSLAPLLTADKPLNMLLAQPAQTIARLDELLQQLEQQAQALSLAAGQFQQQSRQRQQQLKLLEQLYFARRDLQQLAVQVPSLHITLTEMEVWLKQIQQQLADITQQGKATGQKIRTTLGEIADRFQPLYQQYQKIQPPLQELHAKALQSQAPQSQEPTPQQPKPQDMASLVNRLPQLSAETPETVQQMEHWLQQGLTAVQDDDYQLVRRIEQATMQHRTVQVEQQTLQTQLAGLQTRLEQTSRELNQWLEQRPEFSRMLLDELLQMPLDEIDRQQARFEQLMTTCTTVKTQLAQKLEQQREHLQLKPVHAQDQIQHMLYRLAGEMKPLQNSWAAALAQLEQDNVRRERQPEMDEALQTARAEYERWEKINQLIGDASGDKFRRMAQSYQLDVLLHYANLQLQQLNPRYALQRAGETLSLLVADHDLAGELRTTYSLSGGESFLVSLALALGLAGMTSGQMQIESLFIDEGFGSLDAESLQVAMDALEQLHHQGRKVIVISHVAEMHERIPVQVQVQKAGLGHSHLLIKG